MRLENFGGILGFAAEPESSARAFYLALAQHPALAAGKIKALPEAGRKIRTARDRFGFFQGPSIDIHSDCLK